MSFSTADTIVAIATPAGRGGLGVVRLSGPDAARIAADLVDRAEPFTARHATFARFKPSDSRLPTPDSRQVQAADQVVITVFPGPKSYTGEDVAEISAHGSPVVLAAILRAAVDAGARLAEPGEFTLRAFLHGKIDLIQAEAVGDLIDAVTPLQARAAFDQLEGTLTLSISAIEGELFDVVARLEASLDFPDEGYHFVGAGEAREALARVIARVDALLAQAARGRLVREGAQVAIVGSPNVGKSSLFNALLNANRAIVTAIPGTTRDLLTERADIDGLSVGLIDTAGMRASTDVIEQEGVLRARGTLDVVDMVLLVLDRSRPLDGDDLELLRATASRPRVVVVNKRDLPAAWGVGVLGLGASADAVVEISVREGAGLDTLVSAVKRGLSAGEALRDRPAVTNVRHAALLERARVALGRAVSALDDAAPEEFPLVDLQEASQALQEVTGHRTTDDLLRHIFATFCIGK